MDTFAVVSAVGRLDMEPVGLPTWHEMWRSVLAGLTAVEAIYRKEFNPAETSADRDDTIREFFVRCHSLKDWLNKTLGDKSGDAWVLAHPRSLWAACGVANTWKHMIPWAAVPDGRISRTSVLPGRVEVAMTIHDPRAPVAEQDWSEDALVLARRCVADWREFLEAHGLSEAR